MVQAALSGDPAARGTLASRLACVPAIVRGLNRKLSDALAPHEVDDVIQDTLTSIWSKLASFGGRSTIETWAYGFGNREILRNLQRSRRQLRTEPLNMEEFSLDKDDEGDGTPALEPEEVLAIQAKLQTIGPPTSDIIELRHFEELSFEEIGEQLQMPTNTIKTRYYRGLEKLRTLLQPIWSDQ